jgi:hypothetical protein
MSRLGSENQAARGCHPRGQDGRVCRSGHGHAPMPFRPSVRSPPALQLITRAMETTSDFPLILADVVGRTMREAYELPPSGIRCLCREVSLLDFRTRHRLMLDSSGIGIEKVNEHGEFRAASMLEQDATLKLGTYGRHK